MTRGLFEELTRRVSIRAGSPATRKRARDFLPKAFRWASSAAGALLVLSLSRADAAVEIQNGQVSSQWPEIGVLIVSTSGGVEDCTATAIAPRWVLTAAHCVNMSGPGVTYSFVVGSSLGAPDSTSYAIDQVAYDSHFNSVDPTSGFDAGLAHIKDVDLPMPTFKLYSLALPPAFTSPGVDVAIFGFGITSASATDDGTKRYELNKVEIDGTFHNDLVALLTTSGTCAGDSGGPAFIYDYDGFPVIVGLTSFGSVSNCLTPPGYFSRVDKSWPFISTTLGNAGVAACEIGQSCEGIVRDGFDGPL